MILFTSSWTTENICTQWFVFSSYPYNSAKTECESRRTFSMSLLSFGVEY